MFDTILVRVRLDNVFIVMERIIRCFIDITSVEDFTNNDSSVDRLDAICMNLIAATEPFWPK